MDVTLTYNMKRDSAQEGTSEESAEPPSSSRHHSVVGSVERQSEAATASDVYAEWDDRETIIAVQAALEERHNVTLVEADESAYERLRSKRPDIVFNIAEGFYGVSREAQMPAFLEMLQIPYTGSDPLTLGICLDKSRVKEILSFYSIPTARFAVFASLKETETVPRVFPKIVKPLHEGSSKGIYDSSVVSSWEELRKEVSRVIDTYREPALVEDYLPGREFTVALLGNGSNIEVLPIIELKLDLLPTGVNRIYSYEAKWVWDTVDNPFDWLYECPARIDSSLKDGIEKVCRAAYRILRCRDWCRIDVRLDSNGVPNVLELNPLPGIIPDPDAHSCFPTAARAAGISYNGLINRVLDTALVRCGMN
jgi:D-alanine-D-alanine ligase